MHAYTQAHIYTLKYTIHTFTYTYAQYISMLMYICKFTNIGPHTYRHMHACTHTNTQTYTLILS